MQAHHLYNAIRGDRQTDLGYRLKMPRALFP
nr:MAG TPA: hypothetical protein [Caudoviricetes sp.]